MGIKLGPGWEENSYRLFRWPGAKDPQFDDPHCSPTGDTSEAYGCTWYYNIPGQDDERIEPYPFDSYEIEIGYEGALKNGFQQGYLHNVTPHEVAITVASQGNKPLS